MFICLCCDPHGLYAGGDTMDYYSGNRWALKSMFMRFKQ